jgi:hypothetical protein
MSTKLALPFEVPIMSSENIHFYNTLSLLKQKHNGTCRKKPKLWFGLTFISKTHNDKTSDFVATDTPSILFLHCDIVRDMALTKCWIGSS